MPPQSVTEPGIDRRCTLLGAVSTALLSAAGGPAWARSASSIVEIATGRLQGAAQGGVQVFKGVPYGASTGGANRYLPPQPVARWAGVRQALTFGASAPQPRLGSDARAGLADIEAINEDCLFLNVYTPSAPARRPRPVMVWMHGGAWSLGAGTAPALNGSRLARDGDVVVVTINHRLNVFGFLKLEDADERFADAANVGVLDMVAALRWVRDNAAAFGGDPRNVTIFGQSGGGAKVSALMATPVAKGLFHKVIAMSCSGSLRAMTTDEAISSSRAVARQFGLAKLTGEAVQALPMAQLMAARGGGRPSIDGRTFLRHPFEPDAPPTAAGIPMMIGNAATETRMQMATASLKNFDLDAAEVRRRLTRFLNVTDTETDRIIAAYRAQDPSAAPGDILGAVTTDYVYIRNTRREGDLQAATGAPVYSYVFTRRTPVLGGVLHTPHESDVPFVFGAPRTAAMTGDGSDIEPVTRLMIGAFAAFAHTGNPSNRFTPRWPRHDAKDGYSMMMNVNPRVQRDPGGRARASLSQLPFYDYAMGASYTRP